MSPFASLNQTAAATVAALLNSLWQSVALAVVAWIGMRLVPRTNAATRHLLWWVVLAAMLVLPVATEVVALTERRQVRQMPAPPMPAAAIEVEPAAPLPPPVRAPAAPMQVRAGAWPTWIVALWLAGVLLQTARIAWSYTYLRGIKRRAQPVSPELRRAFDAWMMSCRVHRPASLLVSKEIVSPMALGFRHPAVILPASLLEQFEEAELDHVLLHELAHIARRDDWWNLCARMAGAFLLLHPVAAWVLRRIEREREMACDDWVVSMTGAARPYAASLARLFEVCFARRRMMLASGMASRSSHLGERIEMLLQRTREFAPRASMTRVVLSTAILLAFAVIGAHVPRWLAFAQSTPAPAANARERRLPGIPEVQPKPPAPARRTAAARPAPEPPEPAEPAPQPARPPAPNPNSNSFLAALVAAGYGDLAVDEIIALKNAGISAQYLNGLSQSGMTRLAPKEIIDLAQHGVSPEYLRKAREAGIRDLAFQDVIAMQSNGVRLETLREAHALGFGPYNARQAIHIAQNGLGPDLFRALKDDGLTSPPLEEIVNAHQNGLGARNLAEARQYGPNLTLKQIIKLKNAGVI